MSNTIPEGWQRKLLKDAVSILIAGQSPNRKDHAAKAGKYGILKTTAIDWGQYLPNKNQEVLDDFKVNPKHEVKTGDILITKAGPVHRVGVVAYVPETPEKMLVSGKMTLLRTGSLHDSRFVSYALASEYSQKPLKESTTGMALSQTNFTHDTLLEVPLWVPDALPEQQKIATILSSVDDVIEKTRAQIDKLKDLKTGMMQELLTKGIGSGGVPHTEFKDSPVGRIPASWDIVLMDSICNKITDGEHQTPRRSAQGYYLLSARNIRDGYIALNDVDFVPEPEYQRISKRVTPQEDDILISCSGSIGRTAVVPRNLKFSMVRSVAILQPKHKVVDSQFLAHQISSSLIQSQIEKSLSQLAQANLFQAPIKALKVVMPPKSEQLRIAQVINSIVQSINKKTKNLETTQNLKNALMQDLLTGKVRVKTDQRESVVA